MPKETIPAGDYEKNRIDVRWQKEGYPGVGLVTYNPNRRVSTTIEVDSMGVQVGKPEEEAFPFEGWHTELNRYQLNELIRVLRRARDQVFGRDE